jgi:hypothetical protein
MGNRMIKLVCALVIGMIVTATAQEEPSPDEGALSINYFGELGWTVKYGLGDSRELSRHGYANQLLFEQYIALTLDAGVPSRLAHLRGVARQRSAR